jgi:pimeloyl-ACP methyl ester carboxylesterase
LELTMPTPTPFRIAIPDAKLAAIRQRIGAFAWDTLPVLQEQGDPWSAGASLPFMRTLCDHWLNHFDWRAQEAAINRYPQFIANIDGQDIHVLHERGSNAHDTALLLTHGWPGSIVEFLHVIDRFAHPERFGGTAADGIDVVVPALPGFGFSGRPAAPIGPRRIAALWDRLLRDTLGYPSYIAQGGDWGSIVSAMAGLHHGPGKGGCIAIHINLFATRADTGPGDDEELGDDEERAFDQRCQPFLRDGFAFSDTHRTRPQTLAYAVADNPVAQAAWIIDKFHAWTDLRDGKDLCEVVSLDTLLTNLMFYVATASFPTATWIYRAAHTEGVRRLPPGIRIEVPTGFLSLPCELRPRPPRGLLNKTYNLVHFSEFDRGGHFAALEQPDLFVTDVSAFVRQVRGK